MKPFAASVLFILTLFLTLPLTVRADGENWLENGDFATGIDHWRGNGRAPADFAPENPLDKPDPFLSKGLIIPLRSGDWDKVQQDFHGKTTTAVLTLTYQVAPDVKFSEKPDDYVNVPDLIHYDGWQPFNIPPGSWLVFVADFGSAHGTYWEIKPKPGSAPQTIRLPVRGLTPMEDKTITLAFPPGSGNVVILSVALQDPTPSQPVSPLGQ